MKTGKDPYKKAAAALGAVCVAAATEAAVSNLFLKTTDLGSKKPTGKVRAAVFSDLHFSYFGRDGCRLVSKVKSIDPDLILIPGDLFDANKKTDNGFYASRIIKSLTALAPVFVSPGNHDKRFDIITKQSNKSLCEECGATVLDGEFKDVLINGVKMRIGGVFDHAVYPEDYGDRWQTSETRSFIKEFEKTESLKILLMHRPNTIIYSKEERKTDLVLCGHTHGGLWRLPLLGGVFTPELGFFSEYSAGEHDIYGTRMIIGAGLDGYGIIPRMFNRPEIINLKL